MAMRDVVRKHTPTAAQLRVPATVPVGPEMVARMKLVVGKVTATGAAM